ncbi:MAG: PEGA domain-containing protein [Akkermansia sp.]
MSKKLLLSSLCTLLAVSCTHEYKDLRINTSPQGANIRINGEEKASKTPFTTSVMQRGNVAIVAEKPGYVTATRNIEPETDWFLRLVWTKTDERTRYIEEDEVTIPLKKIDDPKAYKPSALPAYIPPPNANNTRDKSLEEPPTLRPMPKL